MPGSDLVLQFGNQDVNDRPVSPTARLAVDLATHGDSVVRSYVPGRAPRTRSGRVSAGDDDPSFAPLPTSAALRRRVIR